VPLKKNRKQIIPKTNTCAPLHEGLDLEDPAMSRSTTKRASSKWELPFKAPISPLT
jgi:hypothetical protein